MCGCSDPVYCCVGSLTKVRHQAVKQHPLSAADDDLVDLVGGDWNMTGLCSFIFHKNGNVIIPTDELHHFSEGWLNHQPVMMMMMMMTTTTYVGV